MKDMEYTGAGHTGAGQTRAEHTGMEQANFSMGQVAQGTGEAGKAQPGVVQADLRQVRFAVGALSIYKELKEDMLIRELCLLLEQMDSERPDIFGIIELYSSIGGRLFDAGTGLKEYFIGKLLHTGSPFSKVAESKGAECLIGALAVAVRCDLWQLQILASIKSEWIREIISHLCKDDEVVRQAVMELPLWNGEGETTARCGDGGDEDPARCGDGGDEDPARCGDGEGETTARYGDGESFGGASDTGLDRIKALLINSRDWADCATELAGFHRQHGNGIFSRYRAFVWRRVPENSGQGVLVGIEAPDPVRFSDLIGYELEREDVIQNTLNFLDGKPANNILLYGDRGTGKSTTVKALVNEYHTRGLRMIEVPKRLLTDFPLIIRQLAGRSLKFILFVDDLAFEDNEENYTALKAALEGGLEAKPGNVLIYATSNRKHLIKERFSDRAGLTSGNIDDEIRAADTMQEKLSLSDRFGMTVVFSSPDKKKYLDIVEGLARKRGIDADTEYLKREALKWELQYNGRSPRTARQFVDWLEGQAR